MKLGIFFKMFVSRWLYTVPTAPIRQMIWFSPLDLPQIAVVSRRQWGKIVAFLREYQHHLSVNQWSGLEAIYPRSHLWAYLYFLQGWAAYCAVLPCVRQQPDRSVIAEVFIRYICQMDDYLDRFDSRTLILSDARQVLRMPEARRISHELSTLLRQFGVSSTTHQRVLQLIVCYRRAYLQAMLRQSEVERQPLREVIEDKEQVAGELWRTWSLILGVLYDVPEALNQRAARLLFHLGMYIQVIDDVVDLPVDYRTCTQNLMIAVAQQHSAEWQQLEAHLQHNQRNFADWRWLQQHTPITYRQTLQLYADYGDPLLDDPHQPAVTRDLHEVVERIRGLAY